jgi:uncharacterized membrane protein
MMSQSLAAGVVSSLISQLAAFLALLLATSAVHKAMSWQRTRSVIHEFAGVPRAAAAPAGLAAALCELLAAGLLFVPAGRLWGAVLAALILSAYLALMVRALLQGRRELDCGCSFGGTAHPLGAYEVARNAVLAAFALLIAGSAAEGRELPVSAPQILAACALLALYGALDLVMTFQPLRRGELL